MKSKKCHPNHSNMIYSSLVHPSGLSGKLDLTANSDFSGISSPPTHGACAWNTQLRRRPQSGPDLCGCPPTPGPPGDARGRAGAHGQVSRGGELRLLRGREGPPGPRPGPTLSTRSPQPAARSFQEGRRLLAEAWGSGHGERKHAPSLYLQQVAVTSGKLVRTAVTTRRPP